MSKKILLLGAGGHCNAVIDVIEQEGIYTIVGIIDKKELLGTKVLGYEMIACDDDLRKLFTKYKYALITVGQIQSNTIRVKLFNLLKDIGYNLPTIISPLSYVSQYAFIDEATVIMHNVLVNANAKIGHNCIINTKALVEHDSIIENHCHISTGVIINGGVRVKSNSFIGSNTTTKEYIEVSGFIKAGSVIK